MLITEFHLLEKKGVNLVISSFKIDCTFTIQLLNYKKPVLRNVAFPNIIVAKLFFDNELESVNNKNDSTLS
jgi:hypothetical protein